MTAAPAVEPPTCPGCGSPMTFRADGQHGPWWGCPAWPRCNHSVSAQSDGTPKGDPADPATRRARVLAHAAFDRLWRSGPVDRDVAYRWLADQLGVPEEEAHIGRLDRDGCGRVMTACMGVSSAAVARWHRRSGSAP